MASVKPAQSVSWNTNSITLYPDEVSTIGFTRTGNGTLNRQIYDAGGNAAPAGCLMSVSDAGSSATFTAKSPGTYKAQLNISESADYSGSNTAELTITVQTPSYNPGTANSLVTNQGLTPHSTQMLSLGRSIVEVSFMDPSDRMTHYVDTGSVSNKDGIAVYIVIAEVLSNGKDYKCHVYKNDGSFVHTVNSTHTG